MVCLELFSGSGKITKTLCESGIKCISVDWDINYNADICCDCYSMSINFFRFFDFIWLSPDCTTYSLASHGIHRKKGGFAVSPYAHLCDYNNKHLIDTLRYLNIPFIIENPRSHFRNMDFVKGLYRITVYYSTYGAEYTKPTDLLVKDIVNFVSCLKGGNK